MSERENGILNCPVSFWTETKEKVDEMHTAIHRMSEFLPELKHLEKLPQIAQSNEDIKTGLMGPATSVGKVDVKVIMPIVWTLCFMLTAMIIWFTGVEPNLPHHAIGHQEQTR